MSRPLAASNASRPRWAEILLAAALLTLLNGLKPLGMDDGAYYYRAAQIASNPLDPYGGPPYCDRDATPGSQLLVPPVFSAWWALGIGLGAHSEWMWRAWEFPIALLLVAVLAAFFRRFAAGVERPLLWLTVFSPACLPGFNLMLDVPALALALLALYCFLRAVDRDSLLGATVAGVLAGLAMQTKFTGVTVVVAMCVYGLLARRWRLSCIASVVAAVVFLGWEAFTYWRYGISQFLFGMVARREVAGRQSFVSLLMPLVTIVGCAAPGLLPLTLLARGAKARSVYWSILAIVGASAALAIVPTQIAGRHIAPHYFTVDLIGVPLWWLCLGFLARQYLAGWRRLDRDDRLLILWLAVEIVLYVPLTPFPAVRRVLGIIVVLTLLLGRAVARRIDSDPSQRTPLGATAALSVAAGLLVWGVDLYDSHASYAAVERAVTFLETQAPSGTRWFVGNWGFQYYAWQAGMKPLLPGQSHLRAGDWIVYPKRLYNCRPGVDVDGHKLAVALEFSTGDSLPLSTQNSYYEGKHPLVRRREPQVQVVVYRVTADYPLPADARVGKGQSLWGTSER